MNIAETIVPLMLLWNSIGCYISCQLKLRLAAVLWRKWRLTCRQTTQYFCEPIILILANKSIERWFYLARFLPSSLFAVLGVVGSYRSSLQSGFMIFSLFNRRLWSKLFNNPLCGSRIKKLPLRHKVNDASELLTWRIESDLDSLESKKVRSNLSDGSEWDRFPFWLRKDHKSVVVKLNFS